MKTQNQPPLSESEQVSLARLSWSLAGKIAAHPGVNLTIATERALMEMPEVVRACNSHAGLVALAARIASENFAGMSADACEEVMRNHAHDARALLQSLNP